MARLTSNWLPRILKANPDKKYKVAGYADKATGSSFLEPEAVRKACQVVYDAFVGSGVDKDQLELVGFGGTENIDSVRTS